MLAYYVWQPSQDQSLNVPTQLVSMTMRIFFSVAQPVLAAANVTPSGECWWQLRSQRFFHTVSGTARGMVCRSSAPRGVVRRAAPLSSLSHWKFPYALHCTAVPRTDPVWKNLYTLFQKRYTFGLLQLRHTKTDFDILLEIYYEKKAGKQCFILSPHLM